MADSPEFRETWIGVYVVLSLLTGARTEELRELPWDHVVAFDKEADKWRPVTEAGWNHEQFAIHVWRSVRATNDTKTRKSRRTIALPDNDTFTYITFSDDAKNCAKCLAYATR